MLAIRTLYCFRIAVRSCAFTDRMPIKRVRTRTGIVEHQHVSPQFFMTAGIELENC